MIRTAYEPTAATVCYCTGACRRIGYCPNSLPRIDTTRGPYYPTPGPHGCVCPPGSEATCQGLLCPRKPVSI